ncbi:MAG: globin [Fluviicola sp.]|nr:MAG: globin [Fluviicola sp.]
MKNTSEEIQSINEITLLVNQFYEKVKQDDLLGPIFEEVINSNWEPHLEKMYRFWETVLLNNHTYHGSPFAPHAKLPISAEHFDRWLELFLTTIDDHFVGEKADEAKWRAQKMAEMFQYKHKHINR